MALLEAAQAADAGRDRDAGPLGLALDVDARVLLGHAARRRPPSARSGPSGAPCACSIQSVGSKSLSSQANLTGILARVEERDRAGAALPGGQVLPEALGGVPERRHRAHPGHDHTPPSVVRQPRPPPTSPGRRRRAGPRPSRTPASSEHRKRTAPATSSGVPSRPSGVLPRMRFAHLLGQHAGQLRVDVAGRDRVHAHASVPELLRERLRERR